MKGAAFAAEEEVLCPDGPAVSPSSSGLSRSATGGFGCAAFWEAGATSCRLGSASVAEVGGDTVSVSIGLWGLEFGTGISDVRVSGCDGAGSVCDGREAAASLATGVVGTAAVFVGSLESSSSRALLPLSKNLKQIKTSTFKVELILVPPPWLICSTAGSKHA